MKDQNLTSTARTEQELTDTLTECLTQLEKGAGSIGACLEPHQDKADALRPLLSLAEQLRQYPRPVRPRAARRAGKRQMLAKVALRYGNRAAIRNSCTLHRTRR